MKTLIVLASLLACGWLSWYVTRRFLWFALEKQFLDRPNHRSSHSIPTPRGGGISFVLVFLLATLALAAVQLLSPLEAVGLFAGGVIAGVGYRDDQASLSVRLRLLVQLAVAAVALVCLRGTVLGGHGLVALFAAIAAGLAFVWLINLTNFMDGIDGIAGTEAFTVGISCTLLLARKHDSGGEAILYAVLAVAAVGFLVYNWPPAKIFMGDAGSGFLGYCFGALALLSAGRGHLSLWTSVILLGVFVIDASFTLASRMLAGETWYVPHRTHAFQHVAKHYGHRFTTLSIAAINLGWLAPWAVLADSYPRFAPLCLALAWLPLVALASALGAGRPAAGPVRAGERARPAKLALALGALGAGTNFMGRAPAADTRNARHVSATQVHALLQTHAAVLQIALLALLNFGCVYFAFFTRFDGLVPPAWQEALPSVALLWSLVQCAVLLLFRVHKSHWQFTSAEEVPTVAGIALVAAIAGAVAVTLLSTSRHMPLPRSIYLLDGIYSVLAFAGARLLSRYTSRLMQPRPLYEQKRVLIYGADRTGVGILSELRRHCAECRVVGFVDDRPEMQGLSISGLHILGPGRDLGKIARNFNVHQVLLSSMPARERPGSAGAGSLMIDICIHEKIDFRVVTSISEDIRQLRRKSMREVPVEELLGREPVHLDAALIRTQFDSRIVMVTGAACSIGFELCRQLAEFSPAAILGFEINETALFFTERELRERFPAVPFIPCIGDIRNSQRLADVLLKYRPEVVYHAAAYKHVPLMEEHLFEVIENNVFGTEAVVRACEAHGVKRLVLISTDKAVRPSSLMGLTKRVAEMLVRAASSEQFSCISTRFGNVLGSAGSVIPIFREQIARGGPVTVTHPAMLRYFMTIPEAAQLVLEASSYNATDGIFVLDMGQPVRIVDLAERMIRRMGLIPGKDIDIEFTGIRPGEKLIEELSHDQEEITPTSNPKIFALINLETQPGASRYDLRHELGALRLACAERNATETLAILRRLVPDYKPQHQSVLPSDARELPSDLASDPPSANPSTGLEAASLQSA